MVCCRPTGSSRATPTTTTPTTRRSAACPACPSWCCCPRRPTRSPRSCGCATEHRIPVTARGSGTGLSGAAIPVEGGVVVSFERMKRIEIDEENQVAVVEPGVTLAELDEITAKHSLTYPVYPGEYSASLGGNVATNAGGMRAVKYGVTRHQVLGLEAVLPTGEVITHRRQVREGLDRLRPHPAHRRLGGDARARHRGDAAAVPAPAAQRDGARPVPHARRGDARRAAHRRQRHRAADPRVHRRADDGAA